MSAGTLGGYIGHELTHQYTLYHIVTHVWADRPSDTVVISSRSLGSALALSVLESGSVFSLFKSVFAGLFFLVFSLCLGLLHHTSHSLPYFL